MNRKWSFLLISSFVMVLALLMSNAIAGTMIATDDDETTNQQQYVAVTAPNDSAVCNPINQEVGATTDETRCLVVQNSLPLPVARSPDALSGFVGASDLETTISCLAVPTARSPDAPISGIGNGMTQTNSG